MPYRSISVPVKKKQKRKTNFKLFIIVMLLMMITVAIIGFLGVIYVDNYKETELCEYTSDDASYKLEIVELGKISEPYGPTNCAFKLYLNDEQIDKYKFIVLNDGELPDEENFEVEWLEDKVKIMVSGEDQKDKLYYLTYTKPEE